MEREATDDQMTYQIVVNHEGQYALWLAEQHPPRGWNPAGKQGSKAECLAFVREVWTDMTPLSLRRA
jgi:MbtH protein